MGNTPSKGPGGDGHPSPSPGAGTPPSSADRRVHRRPSVHAAPGTNKGTTLDPSASNLTATGHSAHESQASAHQRLQSRNVSDPSARSIPDVKRTDHSEKDISSPDPSNPVQVPIRAGPGHDDDQSIVPSGLPPNSYYNASAHLQRPPRLPLPIGDATATPGSPIFGQDDSYGGSNILDQPASEHAEHQKDVNKRGRTIDEEEALDELEPYTTSGVGRAVPTTIEWTSPGEKVYVTGTFVNWEKKFRLHRSEQNPRIMSTTLNLRPGTHHLKFIADGEMRASDNLPTAVDFTNHLVNYIEVSADDVTRSRRESEKPSRGQTHAGVHHAQSPSDDDREVKSTDEEQPENQEPEEIPLGDFRSVIPQALLDIDKEDDSQETPAYQQAASIIGDAPTPPSLPLFLGKSILNGTTPMKDDSSVLNYPNHTVLNHLATSSIKNGVLATSVTTRYKRKYVTTILYKPTSHITG